MQPVRDEPHATRSHALVQLDEIAGRGRASKRANLVLLEADPLADIANTRRVTAVVLAGELITGSELQKSR
jgi:imidazolonepropionase-like amidohydrolase